MEGCNISPRDLVQLRRQLDADHPPEAALRGKHQRAPLARAEVDAGKTAGRDGGRAHDGAENRRLHTFVTVGESAMLAIGAERAQIVVDTAGLDAIAAVEPRFDPALIAPAKAAKQSLLCHDGAGNEIRTHISDGIVVRSCQLSYPRVVQFTFAGLGAAERLSRRAAHRIIGSIASHISPQPPTPISTLCIGRRCFHSRLSVALSGSVIESIHATPGVAWKERMLSISAITPGENSA